MIARKIQPAMLRYAAEYPVLTLLGPRQSGKTTLVRACFPDHDYVNLENPELRRLATEDPNQFFALHPDHLILDEVQRVPELLSWIQLRVDEENYPGRYILTGSHQLRLHEAITQSLAGRTALLRLWPLALNELYPDGDCPDKNRLLYEGFLPRIHADGQEATGAYANYFRTYVERDVRQLMEIRNLSLFENFVRLLAGRVGQILNMSALAGEIGVSGTTLKEWLSILEASFVVFRLAPYYRNFGKRLVKSPKYYFVEPGLACWLLGIESAQAVSRDPLHGNLFENMVVAEAFKARLNQGREPNLYFWRDSNRNEVDLLFEQQRRLTPIEIKSAMTWHSGFSRNLKHFRQSLEAIEPGFLIYAGEMEPESEDCRALHFSKTATIFSRHPVGDER